MPDYSDDERLALDFLTVDRPLSPIQERRAREALVRLLIDDREAPLRPVIRAVLGFLFDPNHERQLVIQTRRRGRKRTEHVDMAAEVAEAVRCGAGIDAAIRQVAEKHKVSERTVRRARVHARMVIAFRMGAD
jgi:hypothetical protein